MTPAPAEVPRQLGRYRLCFELASGGMATVYLARGEGEQGFQKVVALKVVHRHLAREREFVEMFLDEARLASAIDHPNVCQVFDFGEASGVHYLAMEYLMGESLLRVMNEVRRRKDDPRTAHLGWYAARIFVDACEGLHAAHELAGPDGAPLGVVHRDVTPQNLVVTYDGSLKVVDFGVAKAASQLHTTEAGKIKGKLAYVSPEQLRNQPLDRRSDVFALGVCLWEFLALKRLFRRDSEAATLMAVAHDEIPPPSSVRAWVPPELDAIVMRALARDREARYPSARAMGRELSAFLGRTGAALGQADVADWMRSMFEAERARRLELIRRAREVEALGPAPDALVEPSSTGSDLPSVSLAEPLAPASIPGEATRLDPPPSAAPGTRPRGVRRAAPWLAVAVALALAAVAGATLGRGRSEPHVTALAVGRTEARPSDPPGAAPTETPALPAAAAPPAPPAGPSSAPPDPTAPPDPSALAPALAEPSAAARDPSEVAPALRPRPRRPAGSSSAPSGPAPVGRVRVSAGGGGWAEVVVDGRAAGRTPTVLTLPAGRHTVRLLPFGAEPAHEETLDVEADDVLSLRVRIEGAPGPP
jgi:serine/threonine protein kinase